MFLKFTSINGSSIFLDFAKIVYMEQTKEGSIIFFPGEMCVKVKESIEEIEKQLNSVMFQLQMQQQRMKVQ